ncbi:hypothetical protein BV898_04008 [Hypsibius exemplaris]|uniref:Large ribosomal subunit protein P2 n=1 Tax=Hypsibius exemplaris TaxID=2072580 RepID=A0A1W0X4G6_HYPEX|nr:hypothetical protein BV898_04008 [Hypsibius exemplaris]
MSSIRAADWSAKQSAGSVSRSVRTETRYPSWGFLTIGTPAPSVLKPRSRLQTNMRYLAAYLLVTIGGNANPTAADIEKILSSVGIDADKNRVKLVLEKLKGKNIEATIAEGSKKLASLPAAGPAAAAPAAAAKDAAKPAAKEEPKKKEEKKEEPEEDDDMGFGLFD